MILVTSGVHSPSRRRKGCAPVRSITRARAECLDPHYAAVLIGMRRHHRERRISRFDTVADRVARGLAGGSAPKQAAPTIEKALEAGLLKIISKMGISVISSYRGGLNFEAIGLSRALVGRILPRPHQPHLWHRPRRASRSKHADQHDKRLRRTRRSRFRSAVSIAIARGERHALEASSIHQLQNACDTGDYKAYRKSIPTPCASAVSASRSNCATC